jgi:hypothetical protein
VKKAFIFAVLLFIILIPAFLQADYRYYAWTYQYMTMMPGNVEIEASTSYTEPQKGVSSYGYWERQYEMETGVLDRLDFSFYMTDTKLFPFDTNNTTEIRFRSRLKLTEEKGDFFVDPLIYAEYRVNASVMSPGTWEIRGVLAKDMEDLHCAVNLIAEEVLSFGNINKHFIFEYAAGISYPVVSEKFRVGLESIGDFSNNKYYMGPAFTFIGKHFWATVTPALGLNSNSEYIKVQAVMGMVFDLTNQAD